jgi:superfamily I DNA and RNA helicase
MTVNVVRGSTSKPAATAALVSIVEADGQLDGELFTGFPILPTQLEVGFADALLVSPPHGVVVFDVVEGTELGDYQARQDELLRVLQSRLLQHPQLMNKRRLVPAMHTITFAPGATFPQAPPEDGYHLANVETLAGVINRLPTDIEQATVYQQLLSAIENLSTLGKARNPREARLPDSRGAKLLTLEKSIATLDKLQSKAVIETVEGVQRIRGLAGSGKTIVLALKAAYLHAKNPDWRIAVTFNTRSLKDQFRRLITAFTIEQTSSEPNWENLRILNAWGSPGGGPNAGIYSVFCGVNDIPYYNFRDAANAARTQGAAFDWACREALKEAPTPEDGIFDAILVDEAQDLPPEFLRMCYLMLGPERRLVYAYDELQSLDGRGLPTAEVIFGLDGEGRPLVDFGPDAPGNETGARDIVLQKCYRNSRPVLVTAHAVGFGIYREPPRGRNSGLVQLFQNEDLWTDIGYVVTDGRLREGDEVTLARTIESSPPFLEQHSDVSDLIQFRAFESVERQNEWVANEIARNLSADELRYDDIVVINPNGITARNNLSPLRARLLHLNIPNHLAGVDTSADEFFSRETESITFTGIHRAKGNEAGMIYVVNAQEGLDTLGNLSAVRNRLFTAITRSKAWVRILGVGPLMDGLIQEYEQARQNDFTLQFRYPPEDELTRINLIHRELTPEQAQTISKQRTSAQELLEDLEQARIYAEDLDPDVRARLLEILKREDG